VLEAHAAPGPGGCDALKPSHAVAGEDAARLALAAWDRLGTGRAPSESALIAADVRGARAGFGDADRAADLRARALARGVGFARPGAGPAGDVFCERIAAPGRLGFACGADASAAGALGALVLGVDALEWAVAVSGLGVAAAAADWFEVSVLGRLVPGTCGADAALTLAARIGEAMAGRGVEFGGEGVAAMAVGERATLARVLARAGLGPALFPSDEAVRAWLRAWGREADWRWIDADPGERAPLATLDLDGVEPMAAPEGRARAARPLAAWAGAPVSHVVVGPAATLDDLARLASRLAGRERGAHATLTVITAGRALLEAAESPGIVEALRAAGAEISTGEPPAEPAGDGLVVACLGAEPVGAVSWIAVSIESAAAAALAGAVADPRQGAERWDGPPRPAVTAGGWVEIPEGAPAAVEPRPAAVPAPAAHDGPLRGSLLLRAVGPLSPADVMPGGARLEPLRDDLRALAEWTFHHLDPGFAARARERRVGFVAAGPGFGSGPGDGERAALALAELGVRGVLARGFDPAFRRRLLLAGVLPLQLDRAADLAAFEAGDVLEIPGLPEGLHADRPLAIRNLTRGTACDARHRFAAGEDEIARAGGLLGWAAARAAAGSR
jgi:aconitate hydratase